MNSSKTKQDSGLKLSHKLCIRDQIKTERTESSGQPSPDSAAARLCSGTCWIVQEIRDLVSIQMFADFHRASNCSHNGSLKSMQIASLTAKVGGAECSPVPAQSQVRGPDRVYRPGRTLVVTERTFYARCVSLICPAADQCEAVAWTYFHNGVV